MNRRFWMPVFALLLFASCTDLDIYNPELANKAYNDSWKEVIGDIDPNQKWVTAKQVTANVAGLADGEYTLRVFTANSVQPESRLVAEKTFDTSCSITFDYPQSLTDAFVTIQGKAGLVVNGYYQIDGNNCINVNKTRTRADETCPTYVAKEVQTSCSHDGVAIQDTYYYLGGVTTQPSAGWKKEDLSLLVGDNGVFQEEVNNYTIYKDVLGDDIRYKMNSTGPITLTYSFGATAFENMFGYLYYFDGESYESAKRYILTDNLRPTNYITINGERMTDDMGLSDKLVSVPDGATIAGTEFSLVYFDKDGKASYDFPEGINVEFFIINKSGMGYTGQSEHQHTFYSTAEAEAAIGCKTPAVAHVAATTYNFGKTTVLSFEDALRAPSFDNDMNDVMFFTTGDFNKPQEVVPEPIPTAQSWILACEDRGSVGDFDFNDVVFSVSHVAGTTKAIFTPLAAGGTIPSHVYFGNVCLGEIHALLGCEDSGKMINTNEISAEGTPTIIDVPEGFSMSTGSMGGFSIKVSNTTHAVVAAPEAGEIPQMICVDGTSWAWPREWVSIVRAYPEFGEWGANYQTSTSGYLNPAEEALVVK